MSSFAAPVGEITYIRTGVPGPMGLMKVKSKDLEVRAAQFALDMRKSKRKELQSLKRGLVGNLTPRERSVSPMFGGLKARVFPANTGNVAVGGEEESKQGPATQDADGLLGMQDGDQYIQHDNPKGGG